MKQNTTNETDEAMLDYARMFTVDLKVETKRSADGEPWLVSDCDLTRLERNRATVLRAAGFAARYFEDSSGTRIGIATMPSVDLETARTTARSQLALARIIRHRDLDLLPELAADSRAARYEELRQRFRRERGGTHGA
jgi:hypothetical protein